MIKVISALFFWEGKGTFAKSYIICHSLGERWVNRCSTKLVTPWYIYKCRHNINWWIQLLILFILRFARALTLIFLCFLVLPWQCLGCFIFTFTMLGFSSIGLTFNMTMFGMNSFFLCFLMDWLIVFLCKIITLFLIDLFNTLAILGFS